MSTFDDLASIEPVEIWPGLTARPVHGGRMTFTVIELAPGVLVPEHRHDNEQIGALLAGSLRFRIGDEERELAAGATWCIPSDVPHEVEAGPGGATLVEAFAPGRESDWVDKPRAEPAPLDLFR